MRKFMIAAGIAALLCAGSMAMAEPAQVNYESMTLEEVKALANEANAYYKEQTTTGTAKARQSAGKVRDWAARRAPSTSKSLASRAKAATKEAMNT